MKKLENLRWACKWVSHLGCVKGCLDYLGLDVSDAWLFGATAHAFAINVHKVICPSGPTAWNTEMLAQLGKNVGYETDVVFGMKSADDFAEKQEQAWEYVKRAIDEGIPCYGWELDIPEYYVIYGYDDTGYYISGPGCDEGKGPVPWGNLGTSEIGVVEVRSLRLKEAADDKKTLIDALSYALEYARNPEPWTDPRSSGGLKAYDAWIESVERGRAAEFGLAFNAVVWSECRKNAVAFLQEAKDRMNRTDVKPLFEKAIGYYLIVSQKLKIVSELYPFSQKLDIKPVQVDSRARQATEALKMAKESEASGLEELEMLVQQMT